MRKYKRFFLFTILGFLFITAYLIVIVFSKDDAAAAAALHHEINVKNIIKKENSKINLKLTEAQIRTLLMHVESINNERVQKVEETCRKYNLGIFKTSNNKTIKYPPVPQYSVFYFDLENKLTFCPIYKAGSTTWLYNFCLLAGMTEKEIKNSKQQLSVLARQHYPILDPAEAEETFQKTIKLMTVRHPFERLLSAYRDKLENINTGREHGTLHFYHAFGLKIVKKYRKNGNNTKNWNLMNSSQYMWNPNEPKPEGIEPTFQEFIRYLININLANYADDHWIPYHLFCTPCLLRYDIIAKVETLNVDQLYTFHVLGLQHKIKPKWIHKTQFLQDENKKDEPSNLAKIYFKQLNVKEINKLYEKYKIDFELFDYNHSEYLKYASDA